MYDTACVEKSELAKKRKGMTMIELLGVMFIIVVLLGIALGGVTAARDRANRTATQSDIRTYSSAMQQMLVQHPEVMKYTAGKPANAAEEIVKLVNAELEEQWQFAKLGSSPESGGIATSAIKRDAWGNAYGLYVYFDDLATLYTDKTGAALHDSDSCVYLVLCSAGKNGTGGPMGPNGTNFNDDNRQITSAAEMVNNTDGIDDMGVIVRILNGDVFVATFGADKTVLGDLKGVQWIFGKPKDATGGYCWDFAASTQTKKSTITKAASIDQYYDELQVKNATTSVKVLGTWA